MKVPGKKKGFSPTLTTGKVRRPELKRGQHQTTASLTKIKTQCLTLPSKCMSICYVKKTSPVGSVVTGASLDKLHDFPHPQNKTGQQQQESYSWNAFWLSNLNIYPWLYGVFSQRSHTHKHAFKVKTPTPFNKTYFMSHALFLVQTQWLEEKKMTYYNLNSQAKPSALVDSPKSDFMNKKKRAFVCGLM